MEMTNKNLSKSEKRAEILKVLWTVLTIGGIWGILEATLGTVLHLPGVSNLGIYAGSTAIMIPIAYALLAVAYKRLGNSRSLIYIGVVAACIKLSLLMIPMFWGQLRGIVNPAISIVLEALTFAGAMYLFKPTKMLSFKSIGVVLVANISYRLIFVLWSLIMSVAPWGVGSQFFGITSTGALEFYRSNFENFVFTLNYISCAYLILGGVVAYGITYLLNRKDIKVSKASLTKVIYSPYFSCSMLAVALALTIGLQFVEII